MQNYQPSSIGNGNILDIIPNYETSTIPTEWFDIKHLLLPGSDLKINVTFEGKKFNQYGGVDIILSELEQESWNEFLTTKVFSSRYALLFDWCTHVSFDISNMYLKLNELIQKFCICWKEKIIDSCRYIFSQLEMELIISEQTYQLSQCLMKMLISPSSYLERYFVTARKLTPFRELSTIWFNYCSIDISDCISINLCLPYLLLIPEIFFNDLKFIIIKYIRSLISIDLLKSDIFKLNLPLTERPITKQQTRIVDI
jgi:hypothetical protein